MTKGSEHNSDDEIQFAEPKPTYSPYLNVYIVLIVVIVAMLSYLEYNISCLTRYYLFKYKSHENYAVEQYPLLNVPIPTKEEQMNLAVLWSKSSIII